MASYLVIGSTGRQGGGAARELLKAGAKVHALVRNPDSAAAKEIEVQGATLFKGDAADTAAITRALEGTDGVFFNQPDPGPDTLQICQTFIETCAKAGVKTFVLSSTAGTEKHVEALRTDTSYAERQKKFQGYWNLKAGVEDAAKKAGFKNLVIVRAPLLYHIYLPDFAEMVVPELWKERKLVTGLKADTQVPHLLAQDVGKFAAKALLEPSKFAGKGISLAAANLTAKEVADAIKEVTGAEFSAPAPQFEGVEAVGVASPLAGYHEWCNEIDARVDTEALKGYGVEFSSLHEFLEQHKEQMLEALRN